MQKSKISKNVYFFLMSLLVLKAIKKAFPAPDRHSFNASVLKVIKCGYGLSFILTGHLEHMLSSSSEQKNSLLSTVLFGQIIFSQKDFLLH